MMTSSITFADLSQFQPEVASWKTPVLALLKGTLIGAAPYEFFSDRRHPSTTFATTHSSRTTATPCCISVPSRR